ncbi:oxidoreductase [Kitasatospora sp. NPDC056327]|uniref:oxidoreductase n=1 Tax=Kitasatospora sp. NPDC056327 TaxID=3345785 RepID=UPI0035DB24B7
MVTDLRDGLRGGADDGVSGGVPGEVREEGLAARVLRELAGPARRDAARAEELRRLTGEVADGITAAGFPRHFVPRRWGGTAGGFGELVAGAAALAGSCAGAGWCAALYAAHGRLAAYLPEEGQRELWGAGPDPRISAAVVPPRGRAERRGGGWRLDGEWRLASGADHAEWILLASWTQGPDGREHRIFAVPRGELTVLDTWHASGLRASGSTSVAAAAVHVPDHRTLTLDALLLPLPDAARCHTVPYPMVAALLFAAPLLGVARTALREWTAGARRSADPHPAAHTVLTRASARIHMAGLLLDGAAGRADRGAITPVAVAENRRDAATAAVLCREAVDALFLAGGVGAQAPDSLLQRAWRDATAIAVHRTLDPDAAARGYAQTLLGTPDGAA